MANPTTKQKVPFALSAFDAAGVAVDLDKFPTALTDVSFTSDNDDVATLEPTDTGVNLVPKAAGTVNVAVSGVNVNGDTVTSSSTAVTFDAVPVVASLTLVQGDPVAV